MNQLRLLGDALLLLTGVAITLPFALVGFVVAVVEDGYALGMLAYKKLFKWWEVD